MDIVARPEVQLGTCPQDGGHMFRQYAEVPQTWLCGQCGHVSYGDPRHEKAPQPRTRTRRRLVAAAARAA